ncbi:hypothetical protein COOONC_13305 [Cooperia oncophora]
MVLQYHRLHPNRRWLEAVMKDLVKESDPSRQMDAILKSLHSYASSPADLNENDIGKIEELTDHLEDILGYAEITNQFVAKGGLLVIEAFLVGSVSMLLFSLFFFLVPYSQSVAVSHPKCYADIPLKNETSYFIGRLTY